MQARGTPWLVMCAAAAAVGTTSPAMAQSYQLRQVTGISASNGLTAATSRPGDVDHVFALTRDGRVLVIESGNRVLATPFLDFRASVRILGEGGALGLAFDPDYQTNGAFYITHTISVTGTPEYLLVKYTAPNPAALTVDPATRTVIMPLIELTQSVLNHNGGWIGFGPDGYLYISRGEGPVFGTTAQNPATINGKILRIDVRSDAFPDDPLRNYAIPPNNPFAGAIAGADEIFAMGFRNPWRCAFDRLNGDLWIGDVGTIHEEIDVIHAHDAAPVNCGWPCYDGNMRGTTSGLCAAPSGLTSPTLEFSRSGTNPALVSTCVTGGLIYRGCALPAFRGRYLFAACSGSRFGSFDPADPIGTVNALSPTISSVYGFGEDARGEVYVCAASGLYQLLPGEGEYTDCNANGRVDACEIADGSVPDANGDGLPDGCTRRCAADFDASGTLGIGDIFRFLSLWFAQSAEADFNSVGGVTIQDLFDFLAAYFDGCA